MYKYRFPVNPANPAILSNFFFFPALARLFFDRISGFSGFSGFSAAHILMYKYRFSVNPVNPVNHAILSKFRRLRVFTFRLAGGRGYYLFLTVCYSSSLSPESGRKSSSASESSSGSRG
jgi:hypothetical protein